MSAKTSPSAAERFNPTTLDRTIIAIPLLNLILEEKKLIKLARDQNPKESDIYNAVVVLPSKGIKIGEPAQAALQLIVDEALARQVGMDESDRTRHRIGERLPGKRAFFAWLDARTIRRIFSRQEGQLIRGEKPPVIIERVLPTRFEVIIDLNLEFLGGRAKARDWVEAAIGEANLAAKVDDPGQQIHEEKSRNTNQYVFATLTAEAIFRLAEMDAEPITEDDLRGISDSSKAKAVKVGMLLHLMERDVPEGQKSGGLNVVKKEKLRAIYRIWPDFEIRSRITRSISTVKANAAINSFAARGGGITWAVIDTGIQGNHPHFTLHQNILDPASPLHRDFTLEQSGPLVDENGHGTHVAGIMAGEWIAPIDKPDEEPLMAVARYQDEKGDSNQDSQPIKAISGMAPECRLVSLKVLDENGIGNASNLIAAIAHLQDINGYGRRLLIQGVNISIGYDFDPKWFACGQSPLCVEVDRLVKSGVVVVVAAGNTGYGSVDNGSTSAGLTVTINDPGNADLAITVGATHRDMPHVYGVSYFSSKGPTGDGRLKPDLVAPGERITSCAASYPLPNGTVCPSELKREVAQGMECEYIETSGTSMAAPHVSGVIAAFLSVRREFIGQPERVKDIFMKTSTDLGRDRYFQGAGLIDLMRAIQSV